MVWFSLVRNMALIYPPEGTTSMVQEVNLGDGVGWRRLKL